MFSKKITKSSQVRSLMLETMIEHDRTGTEPDWNAIVEQVMETHGFAKGLAKVYVKNNYDKVRAEADALKAKAETVIAEEAAVEEVATEEAQSKKGKRKS